MPETPASYRDVFAVSEFRRLWAAHVLSVVGDQLARVAITVLVYERTESAGLTALTYALTYLPDLIGGAALAGMADRHPRRTVMVNADLARAALLLLMAVPGAPLLVQAGLLVLLQLLAAPFSSARQAVLPDILAGDRLPLGLGAMSITYQAGLVIGFGAGAALVAQIGTPAALLMDAGTFVVSALVIRYGIAIHRPVQLPVDDRPPGQWETIKAGWALVARDSRSRTLLAIACCSGFYVIPEGLAVPYAAELGAGTSAVGLLLAAHPTGMVLGLVILRCIRPDRRLALLGPLAICSSLVLLPTAAAPGLMLTVLVWTFSGLCSAHDMITQATYVRVVPAEHRGQAVGVAIAALRAAQGLGIVIAGILAQLFAPSLIIATAAVLGTFAAASAAAKWSRAVSSRPVFPPWGETDEDFST